MKRVIFTISICCLFFVFNSCQKGDPGPQGPQGNANVHSAQYNVPAGLWMHYGTAGQPDEGYSVTLACPLIGWDIIDGGAVLVYYGTDGDHWTALPFTYHSGTSPTYQYSESWNFFYTYNSISFDVSDSDFQTPAITQNYLFKVVTISSSVVKSHPNFDWKSYKDVKATFNLTE